MAELAGSVAMAADSTLAADGVRVLVAAVAMVATSVLAADGTIGGGVTQGEAALTASSTMIADGVHDRAGAVAATASSSMTVGATADRPAVAALTATSVLGVDAVAERAAAAALSATSILSVDGTISRPGAAALTATSVLTVQAVVYIPGSLINPWPGTSPELVDFAQGDDTVTPPAQAGDPLARDVWYRIESVSSSTMTLTWAGAFTVGFEVWAAPPAGLAEGVEDLTLYQFGAGPTMGVATGEGQAYYVRIHPMDDANNAGTGTLSWSFAARADGVLELLVDPVAYDSPSWLRISVLSATDDGEVEFEIDSILVFSEFADETGTIVGFTVPVPGLTVGVHTLLARDVTTGQEDSSTFEVVLTTATPDVDPLPLGPTTPASPDEVIRWVFEDVLPVGEIVPGEVYTFPNNPSSMSTPHAPRVLNAEHTTAPDGQAIIWEGAGVPVEWNIEGFCFTQAHAQALERWQAQNRRFWAVDHLQRAWVVTFETLDWTPVRDTKRAWSARYRAKLFIYSGPVDLT